MNTMLSHVLSPNHCQIDDTTKSLKAALEKVSHIVANGLTNISYRDVFQQLLDREKLGSTGLGHGVALPHARSKWVQSPVAAFLKLQHPVDFKAEDNQKVDLIFCLFVPEDVEQTHLSILAKLAGVFSKEENRSALRKIDNKDDLRDALIAFSLAVENNG